MTKLDLKLYRGYANDDRLIVFGHAFTSWAPDKYKVTRRNIWHAFSVIQMFLIKPLKNQEVRLQFKSIDVTTKTTDDGYFRFEVPYQFELESGWHEYEVTCKVNKYGIIGKGELLKPHKSKFGIISDIDDTFLVSHSDNIFKKIYIMLFRNVSKRKVFDDVTLHYQALSSFGQVKGESFNSFFYVSSSEWNLYDFIVEFTRIHSLPKAVIKLKKIKSGICDFIFSGKGNHDHKFEKIKDLLSFYPNLNYVLLGDDSQRDVYIYRKIIASNKPRIKAVYIRQTSSNKKPEVEMVIRDIESLNIPVCYCSTSITAIEHSKNIGLI